MEQNTFNNYLKNPKLFIKKYHEELNLFKAYQSLRNGFYILSFALFILAFILPTEDRQNLIVITIIGICAVIAYIEIGKPKRPKFEMYDCNYVDHIFDEIEQCHHGNTVPVDHRFLGTNWPNTLKWIQSRTRKYCSIEMTPVSVNNKLNFIRLTINKTI